ncbi:F-box only protein 36 [Gopherus flavomarginatus]|uniref:F-box only protein 36 n=1 Tax=Gopherus flavomarginatus TaxID=286002 RepID=UPI0021CC2D80|nr:F-box only protein 36 [Gopherus flavomarginatus]XP_050822143.1 F-box only protein 36 [Gopherus flavomarginatus]XP_050822144.1 F-box only protein 36 [Gopherus flavomarginatus]
MASLLQENLFETRAQAPAPSKDFYQLIVTRKEVIFRWWKISLRSEFREAKPGELKESHEYFLDDPSLQIQIAVVFGANTLEHIFNLCRGNFDFLERLPDPLLLYIISFLELEDIARLSQVSHRFKTICNSDTLWEKIVQNLCGAITPEMRALAQEVGWKQFFFTNKLQLQLQLRRRRQKQDDSKKLKTK